MTKADLVQEISKQTGIDRNEVLMIVEAFMETVKGSLSNGKNVYLRGFGSFIIKRKAEKTGRNRDNQNKERGSGSLKFGQKPIRKQSVRPPAG